MCLVIPLTWFEIDNGFSKTSSNYKTVYKTVYKVDEDVKNIFNKWTFFRAIRWVWSALSHALEDKWSHSHHNIILSAYTD